MTQRLPISCQRFSIRPCVFVWESGQKTFPQVTGCMMQSRFKAVTLTRNNYDVLQEVILRMKINKREQGKKLNIGETPITFNKRMYGESKRQLLKFIRGYIVTLFMLIRINLVSLLKRSKKK